MGYPHFKKPPQLPELFGVSVQAIPGLKTLKMLEASRLQHADSCPPFLWQSKVISFVLFERLQKRWFSKKKKGALSTYQHFFTAHFWQAETPPGFSSPQVFPPAISFNSLGMLLPEVQLFNVPWTEMEAAGALASLHMATESFQEASKWFVFIWYILYIIWFCITIYNYIIYTYITYHNIALFSYATRLRSIRIAWSALVVSCIFNEEIFANHEIHFNSSCKALYVKILDCICSREIARNYISHGAIRGQDISGSPTPDLQQLPAIAASSLVGVSWKQ